MCKVQLEYKYKSVLKIPQSFTGKERDSETGFSYFGSRYYDSDILTGWLSVDPLADKYPSLSPYAYCGWNPIIIKDPNGEKGVKIINTKSKTITVRAIYYVISKPQLGQKKHFLYRRRNKFNER